MVDRNASLSRFAKLQFSIAALTLVVSIIFGFMTIPLIKRKRQLETEVTDLTSQATNLRVELKESQERVERAQRVLNLPASDVQLLLNRGVVFRNVKGESWDAIAEQCIQAAEELKQYQSLDHETKRRKNILIEYFVRASDKGGVVDAMTLLQDDYGFKVIPNERKMEPNTATNAIWLTRENLEPDDVKIIAYYLIRAGFQLKYIGPPSSTPQKFNKTNKSVFIVAEPKAEKEPTLTVEKIRSLSSEILKQGTARLN